MPPPLAGASVGCDGSGSVALLSGGGGRAKACLGSGRACPWRAGQEQIECAGM